MVVVQSRWQWLRRRFSTLSWHHHCQYHACSCPGNFRSQGISRHSIDQISKNIPSLASWQGKLGLKAAPLQSWLFLTILMPQSHPTTGPLRFLSPVRFLACKAEWSTHRNFISVLFLWSHHSAGLIRLDTSAHLWFGWIIHRTPRVPRAMPVQASYGPRTGIFNVFHILRDPYGARACPARVPYGALTDM